MSRSRASAKAAGARFERIIADCLAEHLDDRIDRMVRRGNKDRGDISGVRCHGQPVAVEVKNTARMDLPSWTREAEIEAGNLDALAGVVISKRHGNGDPLDQWVHMTVREFIALITGQRMDR